MFKRAILAVFAFSLELFAQITAGHEFVANKGQFKDANIAYAAKTYSGALYVRSDGQIIHSLSKTSSEQTLFFQVAEILQGAKKPGFKSLLATDTRVNYFLGAPKNWKSISQTHKILSYGEIYDKIELQLIAHQNNVEKLFIIKSGADAGRIKLAFKGANGLRVNARGELVASTKEGEIAFSKPLAWVLNGGQKDFVGVKYTAGKGFYGFKVQDYDRSKTLYIDPLLASTFFNGGGTDAVNAIVAKGDKIYAAGYTTQNLGITGTPGTAFKGNRDGFIASFNKDLNKTHAITYIGGNGIDEIYALAKDTAGNIYAAGFTASSDFSGGGLKGDKDGFIAKFGENLNYMTSKTVGGNGEDVLNSLAVNSAHIYAGGYSSSTENWALDGNQTSNKGNYDGVLLKFDLANLTQQKGTFLGGDKADYIRGIAYNGKSLIFTGESSGGSFPKTFGSLSGDKDFFVGEINQDLKDCNTSVYGGAKDDEVYAMDLNASKDGFTVVGSTLNSGLTSASNALMGAKDGFFASFELPVSANSLKKLTYIGGANDDILKAISIDHDSNKTFLAGYTKSANLGATDKAYSKDYKGGDDIFIARYKDETKEVLSYAGGSGQDQASCILYAKDFIYVGGSTTSSDFPRSNINKSTITQGSGFGTNSFVLGFDYNISQDEARLVLDTPNVNFGNIVLTKTSAPRVVKLKNTGTKALEITSVDLNNTALGFEIMSTGAKPCKLGEMFSLPARDFCEIEAKFSALGLNEKNASIIVKHSGAIEDNVTLDATGILDGVQKIDTDPKDTLTFSTTTPKGGSSSEEVTIKNIGSADLVVSAISVDGALFSVETGAAPDGCTSLTPTITRGSSCKIKVKFSPTDVGEATAKLRIRSNDATIPEKTLEVKAQAADGLIISPKILNFGDVPAGGSAEQKIIIENKGATAVTINSANSDEAKFSISQRSADCGTAFPVSLTTNKKCELTIKVSPVTQGELNGKLTITHTDPTSPSVVDLKAHVIAPSVPSLTIDPPALNFGLITIGGKKELIVTLGNAGNMQLSVTDIKLDDADGYTIDYNKGEKPCGSATPTLNKNEKCTFGVIFAPEMEQTYDTELVVKSNSAGGDKEINVFAEGTLAQVNPLKLEEFSASPIYGNPPLPTSFHIKVSGGSGAYNYLWDFTGGQTAATQDAQHIFTAKKDYPVKVKVTDSANPALFLTAEVNVSVSREYLPLSIKTLGANPTNVKVGEPVNFNLLALGGSNSYKYKWDFNDTMTSALQNPTHIFAKKGEYLVDVNVTDANDPDKTTSAYIKIFVVESNNFAVEFSASPLEGDIPLEVTFKAKIKNGKPKYQIKWDFGDGTTTTETDHSGSEITIQHRYDKAGSFPVLLEITDADNLRSYSEVRVVPHTTITTKHATLANGRKTTGDYCFIATAAYGNLFEKHVVTLRDFRDKHLLKNAPGRAFVQMYYKYSPPLADFIRDKDWLRGLTRALLTPVVAAIKAPGAFLTLTFLLAALIYVRAGRGFGFGRQKHAQKRASNARGILCQNS